MSQHVKRDRSTRPRFLGAAVTGVALLLGGAFAAQAAADTGAQAATPKVATSGDTAPAVSAAGGSTSGSSTSGSSTSGGTTSGGTTASGAAKVVGAGKGAATAGPAVGGSSGIAPKVIEPGSGVAK
ncbi:hypothetical protein [Streptomyces sp. NPDC006691]|uniref:hypothetical protein n=1 Tax=Streptomyces sp. NPDC006691 TaxID=3364757 RepID=UPI0036CF77D5